MYRKMMTVLVGLCCLLAPVSAAEKTITAKDFPAQIGNISPGDVWTVTGEYRGAWRISSRVAGTKAQPITLKFEDVTLDARTESGSAFVLSGNGQPLHLRIEGRLTVLGGRNNWYVSRSHIELAESAELCLVDAREDGMKITFDVTNNPVEWSCQSFNFLGRVEITGAGQDGVDMGGTGYTFADLCVMAPNDDADGAPNACAFRDKGSGAIGGTLALEVCGGVYPYSVLSLGGRCDNSLASRWECENVTARVRFEDVATPGQLIAFQAARKCEVRAEAVDCTYGLGWRVVREPVSGGSQLLSTDCTINGFLCEDLQGDLPPVPVEITEAVLRAQIETLAVRLAEIEAHVSQLMGIVEALKLHTHKTHITIPAQELEIVTAPVEVTQ